ncbi:MAG: hypothetical protein IPK82_06790 [Polyangiaceae bacterium]|nr:hypothetical protein [Polyangiaceae bacterium]
MEKAASPAGSSATAKAEVEWRCRFEELINVPEELKPSVLKYVPCFQVLIDDLYRETDEGLRGRCLSTYPYQMTGKEGVTVRSAAGRPNDTQRPPRHCGRMDAQYTLPRRDLTRVLDEPTHSIIYPQKSLATQRPLCQCQITKGGLPIR